MLLELPLNRPMSKTHYVKKLSASDINVKSKFSRSLVYSVKFQSEDGLNEQHVLTHETPLQVSKESSNSSLLSKWRAGPAVNAGVLSSSSNAIVLHVKDQRPLVKYNVVDDTIVEERLELYMNLSRCKYRDRLLLRNGMKLVLIEPSSNQRCEIEFCILNGSGDDDDDVPRPCDRKHEQADVDDSGDDSNNSEEETVEEMNSNSPRPNIDSAESQCGCDLPKQSALKSSRSVITREKSITWSPSVEILKAKPKEDEIRSSISVNIRVDGEEKMNLTSQERFVMFGGSSACYLPVGKIIQLPLSTTVEFLFGLSIQENQAFLTLPRLKPSDLNDQVQVLLAVPSQVDHPIDEGDVLEYGLTRTLELSVDAGQVLRKPPRDDQISTCQCNPAHAISELAIETIYQGNNAELDGDDDGTGKVYLIDKNLSASCDLRIGRTGCDINMADRHVSRHHATIERGKGIFFLCRAESERKSIYLLLGKKDSHYRPPMSLRTGDEFRVGRSDFKVVYQQRGIRAINQSLQEEMVSRLHAISRPSNELRRSKFQKKETTEDDKTLLRSFGLDSKEKEKEPLMILMKLRGPDMGKYYLCHPTETTIGSYQTADIFVPTDRKLSAVHARVFFDLNRERWVLQDLQSQHGTYMKFDRSDPPFLLAIGDVILMGSTRVRILGRPILPDSRQEGCAHQ